MHIHKKGYSVIAITGFFLIVITVLLNVSLPDTTIIHYTYYFLAIVIFLWAVSFFRVPKRFLEAMEDMVYASADGTVVVVEEVYESEYFKDKRMQVSVFMSPLNVHVNWFPFHATVSYLKYHPGKFLIANHPKSSTENERNTVVFRDQKGREILVRQIAGMMARRIICFVEKATKGKAGDEFGLIRFGSRVDFYLPLDAEVFLKIGDKVTGKKTVIARLK